MGTHGPIKYQADFAFFDVIDSDAKAYWLGFIATTVASLPAPVLKQLRREFLEHQTNSRRLLFQFQRKLFLWRQRFVYHSPYFVSGFRKQFRENNALHGIGHRLELLSANHRNQNLFRD